VFPKSNKSDTISDMTGVNWRKSTYSLANGNCVEVGTGQAQVAVRDSRDPDGPTINVSPRAWIAFTGHVKRVTSRHPGGQRRDPRCTWQA
jgi:hypothetical protein